MTLRTDTKVVTFRRPFRLAGLDGEMPAGVYAVETDEERLALSFEAYRRVATWIRVPLGSVPGSSQTVPIDPAELETALARDAASDAG
jgi:hypothetical protein